MRLPWVSRERYEELQHQSQAWERRYDEERTVTKALMCDITNMQKSGFTLPEKVIADPSIPLTVDEADQQAAMRMEMQS